MFDSTTYIYIHIHVYAQYIFRYTITSAHGFGTSTLTGTVQEGYADTLITPEVRGLCLFCLR